MAYSQSLEQRIDAHSYGIRRKPSCFWNGRREQTDTADNHKLGTLMGCEAEPEHTSKILYANQLCGENIRDANRIDELGTHILPRPGDMPDREDCNHFGICSTSNHLKIESKQAFSGSYPLDSTNVVDGFCRVNSQIGAAS